MEQDATPTEQSRAIIEEVQELNQIIGDPKYQNFSRTTYWHQQNSDTDNKLQKDTIREINESLARIEAKLTRIISLLENR